MLRFVLTIVKCHFEYSQIIEITAIQVAFNNRNQIKVFFSKEHSFTLKIYTHTCITHGRGSQTVEEFIAEKQINQRMKILINLI